MDSNKVVSRRTLPVIAEGVETDAVFHHLGELNCDAAQGYFIQKPQSAHETALWLTGRTRPATL